ncbi:MAG: cytochrome c maturation protein CcmE [Planctomycetales bacterium]|nr:cytochrome c maturation protein CcmE [Planctomycetales bacterium]
MTVATKLALGGTVLSCVVAYVAYLGASSSWQYYLTVDECAASAHDFVGKSLRVSGRIAPESLDIRPDRSSAQFSLVGATSQLQAECAAPLPDNLAEDIEVVVEGRLNAQGQLVGDKVLTRCASKYEVKQD